MKSVDLRMAELGGTFVPDNHGCSGRVFATLEFTPEIEEEEKRLQKRSRFIPVEELPDTEFSEHAIYLSMPGTLRESLSKLLATSPQWTLTVYQRAKGSGNDEILALLPGVVRELIANGTYSLGAFRTCVTTSGNCYRTFRKLAKGGCPVAHRIFTALSAPPETVH